METVLKYLINSLENGNILVAFAVIFVTLIFKAKSIFEFFENRKESKNKSISEIILNENISEDVKTVIKERINTISFETATGIYAENPLREKLIKIYNESKGDITLHQIKMAMPHIKYRSGNLNIEIGKFETFEFIATNSGALILFLFSLILSLIPATTEVKLISQFLSIYGIAAIFSLISVFMFKSSLPYIYAKRIKPLIEKE